MWKDWDWGSDHRMFMSCFLRPLLLFSWEQGVFASEILHKRSLVEDDIPVDTQLVGFRKVDLVGLRKGFVPHEDTFDDV